MTRMDLFLVVSLMLMGAIVFLLYCIQQGVVEITDLGEKVSRIETYLSESDIEIIEY